MPTEADKTGILVKIDELKKEKAALNQRLEEERNFHIAAWNEYGSELCAGEMADNEAAIAKKIADVSKKINILEQYLIGGFSAEERARLLELIAANSEAIRNLEAEKLKLQECLNNFNLLDALLKESK